MPTGDTADYLLRHKAKRLIRKILIVVVFTVAYLLVVVELQACLFTVFRDAPFYESMEVLVFGFSNILMFGLLFYYRHKTRDQWIKSEAEKWIATRSR